jgi:hypothetical protein
MNPTDLAILAGTVTNLAWPAVLLVLGLRYSKQARIAAPPKEQQEKQDGAR